MEIEPAILGLWHVLCLLSHALTTELTWQVLIEGNFTCVGTIDFWMI